MAIDPQALLAKVQGLGRLQGQQLLGLLLGMAAIIALIAGAWMWSQAPDYRVLYGNLSDRDGGAVIAALQQMNIPYKAEGGGSVLVPASQVHEARLRLASQGLPKGGLVGFELMENQKLGASQFLEQVNYQRALEGELAKSIQSLSAVQGARVHLAISKPSVFVREQQKSSASVLLNLGAGKSLDPSQVSAIVHLVSSSVADMPVKNVTVVDQNGNLLSASGNGVGNAVLDPGQLKYVQELEQGYIKRIEAIVTPIVGPANVRAEVTADVDFSQIEHATESYKPNQTAAETAIRSQQSTETTSASGQTAAGVPGALSNQAPSAASAPLNAPPAAAAGGGGAAAGATASAPANIHKESTVNYELDKTIKYTRQPVGAIKRLAVAVVVNQRKVTDSKGRVSYKPLSAAEMAQITDLVKEAVGYSQARGDTLNVVNSAFTSAEKELVPETPWWKQSGTLDTAREVGKHLLIAAVVIYLVLGVLRPLLKSLSVPWQRSDALLGDSDIEHKIAAAQKRQAAAGYEQNLQAARQVARQEPKVVANVVKNWVSGDEG